MVAEFATVNSKVFCVSFSSLSILFIVTLILVIRILANEYFKAHKDVLSSASDYFSAMFSHDMAEKGKDYIELKGISLGGFQIMLEYFYHGHITLVMESVEHCLEASRFFHVSTCAN